MCRSGAMATVPGPAVSEAASAPPALHAPAHRPPSAPFHQSPIPFRLRTAGRVLTSPAEERGGEPASRAPKRPDPNVSGQPPYRGMKARHRLGRIHRPRHTIQGRSVALVAVLVVQQDALGCTVQIFIL